MLTKEELLNINAGSISVYVTRIISGVIRRIISYIKK